jgi:WD40 repeat protein
MLSAGADGEIVFWNLPARKPLYQINAHPSMVRGLVFANNRQLSADNIFVSTGDDKKVNIWSVQGLKKQFEKELEEDNTKSIFKNYTTRATFTSKHMLQGLDHSYGEDIFATAGSVVQIWSYERSSPL